jgi:hypothetical protein
VEPSLPISLFQANRPKSAAGDDILDRRPLYAAILVLAMLVFSSFYLNYSADRGRGEVAINDLTIITSDSTKFNVTVFQPQNPSYEMAMPVVLTIPSTSETYSDLFAFNIEMARRNMTVVSVHLSPWSSGIAALDNATLNLTSSYCMQALNVMQQQHILDRHIYGMLFHSDSFPVAVRIMNKTSIPKAAVCVGNINTAYAGALDRFHGNLLFLLGSGNEFLSTNEATSIMQQVSGIPSFEPNKMYGAFVNHTAYMLDIADADASSELTNPALVAESCSWMVQALQGTSQFVHTLDVNEQVYQLKFYAADIAFFSVAGLVVVCAILVFTLRPSSPDKGLSGSPSPQSGENRNHAHPAV